jgi:ankyrin repeat protein
MSGNQGGLDLLGKSILSLYAKKAHARLLSLYASTADHLGRLPLWRCLFCRQTAAVKALVEFGADVDAEAVVSLYLLAKEGRRRIAVLGKYSETSDDVIGTRVRRQTVTPLWVAAALGLGDIVSILVNAGAFVNWKTMDNTTPLWVAAFNGHDNVVRLLLVGGAGVHVTDNNNQSALFAASSNGHGEVVKHLLKAEADGNTKDRREWSPLIASAYNGHTEVVKCLLTAGLCIDINAIDTRKRSALYCASLNGHGDIVELLLNAEASFDAKDEDSRTPLIISSWNGDNDIVKFLLETGADVNGKDKDNQSALFAASHNGHHDVVNRLVLAGADVNSVNRHGWCALAAASRFGHAETVETLVGSGADINNGTNGRHIALSTACKNGHKDVVKILCMAGAAKSFDEDMLVDLLRTAASKGHNDILQLIGNILEIVIRVADASMMTPLHPFDLSTIGNHDTLRIVTLQAGKCKLNLINGEKCLPFYDVVGNMRDLCRKRRNQVLDASSLPSDIGHSIPKLSDLINLPGVGNINAIPEHKAADITNHVDNVVQEIIGKYNAFMNERHTQFLKLTVQRCGSAAEGTKIGYPDEYDFLLKCTPYKNDCTEILDFKDGYKFFGRGSEKVETSSIEKRVPEHANGSKRFHDEFWRYLVICGAYDHDSLDSQVSMVSGGGHASTEIKIKWFEDETRNQLLISVDLVPVLCFKDKWPDYCIQNTWLMDKEQLKSRGFALVAKPPHQSSSLGKGMREDDRVKLWRISFSHLETEHIASLPSFLIYFVYT